MLPPLRNHRRVTSWLAAMLLVGLLLHALPTIASGSVPSAGPEYAQSGESQHAARPDTEREAGHTDPFSTILLELAAIILAAVFGRWLAGRLKQPSVLGELVIGVILGNVGYWLGVPFFTLVMHLDSTNQIFAEIWEQGASVAEAVRHVFPAAEMAAGGIGERMTQILTGANATHVVIMGFAIWLFSNLGVILLLFLVGLESSVEEMMQVGGRSLMVAVTGVVAPFLLGLGAGIWLLPEDSTPVHLFLAATLCATSVGITARVFKDLYKLDTREAKIILGAAVIDDILGLIILAIVVGIVATGELNFGQVLRISFLSAVFLGVVILLGDRIVRRAISLFSQLERSHTKLLFSLTLAFTLAWISNLIGLAPIVGAFAAGLILNEEHFTSTLGQRPTEERQRTQTARELIEPLEAFFAPIFFVLMGMQVNLGTFADPQTVWLALAFTVAAIIGKLVAGLPAGSPLDRLSVGIGMVPRGEVGLIFASIGKGLGVVSDSVFSAVVIMVIVTTLITPVALRWSLFRQPASKPIGG